MKQINKLGVTLAVLASLAIVPVTSQAATVILDGATATSIEDIILPVRTPAGDFFYDVTFVFGDAFSVYGADLDFQFDLGGAEFAMTEVIDALELSPAALSVGSSALDNSDVFFIGYGVDEAFVITVRG
jgi:hypothetical protein